MEDFLHDTDPCAVQKLEESRQPQSGWTPFLPYLKVFFSPKKLPKAPTKARMADHDSLALSRLQELSLETMLFVVQVMTSGDPYKARRQLLEEKLLPYALCLSANVSSKLLARANSVVAALRSNSSKPVPIPKLNVMTRAKLASMHFGLKKAMSSSAEELKLEVSPPPPPAPAPAPAPRSSIFPKNFEPLFCVMMQ